MNIKAYSFVLGLLAALTACSKDSAGPPASPAPLNAAKSSYVPYPGALTQAVVQGDKERVLGLIQAGADISEDTSDDPEHRITPLMAAIVMGRSEIAFELLRLGSEQYSRYEGFSAVDFALYNHQELSRTVRESLLYKDSDLRPAEPVPTKVQP